MKIQPYNPYVKVLWSTPKPFDQVWNACSNTQKGVFADRERVLKPSQKDALINYLVSAEHTSPLEHAYISFELSQISRACADQVRTHRMASHTLSSTHYQYHGDYGHRVHHSMLNNPMVCNAVGVAREMYHDLIEYNGIAVGDARQLLPLSTEVRYIMTINARSLLNFLQLRLCYRNTPETIMVAQAMGQEAAGWFPEMTPYFTNTPCQYKDCKQGKMRCDFVEARKDIDESWKIARESEQNATSKA